MTHPIGAMCRIVKLWATVAARSPMPRYSQKLFQLLSELAVATGLKLSHPTGGRWFRDVRVHKGDAQLTTEINASAECLERNKLGVGEWLVFETTTVPAALGLSELFYATYK